MTSFMITWGLLWLMIWCSVWLLGLGIKRDGVKNAGILGTCFSMLYLFSVMLGYWMGV